MPVTGEVQNTQDNQEPAAVSLFLIVCQIFFAVSIFAKVASLIWNSSAFSKPDFILGISQIKLMEIACVLELCVLALLGFKNVGDLKKLGGLLIISSGFITYHVWAWIIHAPPCPCMGNLIAQAIAAKISFMASVMLFVISARLLFQQKRKFRKKDGSSFEPNGTP